MRKALGTLPGVADVKTDVNPKNPTATITVEKGKFDPEKAISLLADEGYEDSTVQQ